MGILIDSGLISTLGHTLQDVDIVVDKVDCSNRKRKRDLWGKCDRVNQNRCKEVLIQADLVILPLGGMKIIFGAQ